MDSQMPSANTASKGASHEPLYLSIGEKLVAIMKMLVFLAYLLCAITYDIVRYRRLSWKMLRVDFMKHVSILLRIFSLRELQALIWPTGINVSWYCMKEGLSHSIVLLVDDYDDNGDDDDNDNNNNEKRGFIRFPPATLHFINCNSETTRGKILLYFHGGGFLIPMLPGHFKFARLAAQKGASNLVFLEYTLAPKLKYPGQLAQAALALRYLLRRHDASEILIGGDSIGANLCLAVLAHLREPHPLLRPIFEGEQRKLRGAFCVSPKCTKNSRVPGLSYRSLKDVVDAQIVDVIGANWEPTCDDVWAIPMARGAEFWGDVMAERLLIVAGLDEIYIDHVKAFAAVIGARGEMDGEDARVQLTLCPGEIHTQAILDAAVGYRDGFMLTRVLAWLHDI